MRKTVVINVVALTRALMRRGMPRLSKWAGSAASASITPAFPAVTCSAQSDYLTGVFPDRHGVVGNGWYDRQDCEVKFWKQANPLVGAPKVWEAARAEDSAFTVANLFWWFNMHSTADYAVTPRPMYPADGRKLPDVHTTPGNLREDLQQALGTFPLFEFWGPRSSIRSSEWIANAARHVEQKFNPTLTLIYLPHLDYNLQKAGVSSPAIDADLSAIDRVASDLIDHYESRGASVIVLSEYGIVDVTTPVHPNRALREHGLLAVRDERGHDMLDTGASAAFAVADHQIAHVYLNDQRRLSDIRSMLERLPGVERVLDRQEQAAVHLNHQRSGDLVAVAKRDAWFTYYYWLDDDRASDFARTVDIHRKPGYDPVELFLDPKIGMPAVAVGWKLFKRTLGFRTLLDVIPLDATLVKGSHGRQDESDDDGPVILSRERAWLGSQRLRSVDVYEVILRHLRDGAAGPQAGRRTPV